MDDFLKQLAEEPFVLPGRTIDKAQRMHSGPNLTKRRGPVEVVSSLPALTTAQVKERRVKAASAKLESLLDYYATTDANAEHVAQLLAIYRLDDDGVDDDGKPKQKKVLDVERVAGALKWRREH